MKRFLGIILILVMVWQLGGCSFVTPETTKSSLRADASLPVLPTAFVPSSSAESVSASVVQTQPEQTGTDAETVSESGAAAETAAQTEELTGEVPPEPTTAPPPTTEAPVPAVIEDREAKETVIAAYQNLALANVPNSRLNIREAPSSEAKIIGYLLHKAACHVLDGTEIEEGGLKWLKISSGILKEGYVCSDYLLRGEEAREAALTGISRYAVVTVSSAYVRFTPNDGGGWDNRRHVLYQGESCRVEGEQPGTDWHHVYLTDIWKEGYIHDSVVRLEYRLEEATAWDTSDAQRDRMLEYAERFLNYPYVWGGESLVTGTDCSGYVMLLYRKFFGIDLPHYSPAQAERGRKISFSELKAGDLIFYDTMHLGRISHVAMYMGNEKVIQAFNTDRGIIITRYDFAEPVMYRRIIGE